MSLLNITADTLSRDTGKPVPPIYVVIAKHSVLGVSDDSICEILNCSDADLAEVKADPIYQEIRQVIAATQADFVSNQTTGWDALEELALGKLAERLPFERDAEFLLRVAAVANKAQRRTAPIGRPLDPSRANGKTVITLTQRLVERINSAGQKSTLQERQLSISDGSMENPSFEEVDDLLSVSRRPDKVQISTHAPEVDLSELDDSMRERFG